MWSNSFGRLQKQMTLIHAVISFALILLVLYLSFVLIWWAILGHEKEELANTISNEANEWVLIKKPPCGYREVNNGSMFACIMDNNGQIILNQMQQTAAGRALFEKQDLWPKELGSSRTINLKDENDKRIRYLVAVGSINEEGKQIGKLYMFKNINFYYFAALATLNKLAWAGLFLLLLACGISYWLAGRNIKPVKEMYEKLQQFTADASHEMRTPLAVMRLAVDSIRMDDDTKLSEFSEESLGMLDSENRRLTTLTENLMSLARSDAETLNLEMKKVNLSELCENVSTKLALITEEKNISLMNLTEEGLSLRGNASSLERLLIILLDNSIKYSPEGSQIKLKAYQAGSHIIIDVIDEGEGIADEDKAKVFDRFYRVDKARSRAQGGLGLGLSLASAIVKAHHGQIFCLDNKPQGTIMRVTI